MRKSLSEILRQGDQEKLSRAWGETEAADDFAPLPAGEYVARVLRGEPFNGKSNGTPGYKLTFRVLEGGHEGRQFWHDVWLTEAAVPMAKRDLANLGVTSPEQLDKPLPPGIRCKVKLTLRRDDDGTEYNRVKTFTVLGIDAPEADPFAPADNPQSPPDAAGGAT
ncbi:MAG TPA: DUF669 domain-containing protein [Pirellulales bacterium]|jgi:hypothetical protein